MLILNFTKTSPCVSTLLIQALPPTTPPNCSLAAGLGKLEGNGVFIFLPLFFSWWEVAPSSLRRDKVKFRLLSVKSMGLLPGQKYPSLLGLVPCNCSRSQSLDILVLLSCLPLVQIVI